MHHHFVQIQPPAVQVMKTHKKSEVQGVERNQSIVVEEVEHSCRMKEVQKKNKNLEGIKVDKDATVTSNEERQVEKDKKKNKLKKEVIMDDNDRREREKKEEEKENKKSREDESKDDIAGEEKKVKKKEKMDNIMIFGDEGERQLEKRKKKKKQEEDDLFVGYEDEKEVKERKKEKRDHMLLFDNKEGKLENKKKKKERGRDLVACNKERKVKRKEEKRDDMKADNRDKVDKEKKKKKKDKDVDTKDDSKACNQGQKKVRDEKKNKKRKRDDVEAGIETIDIHSGNKAENLEFKGDARKKIKLNRDGMEGKADFEVPKNKKRVSAAESSKHVTPKSQSKKVRFSDEVKLFPPCDSLNNSNKNEGGLVLGKRFSKEEDEMIRKAVSDYVEANQLGEEGLYMVLRCKSYPKIKDCWKVIGATLPWRPNKSVYWRAHILYERGDSKWTPEEVELVKKAHEKYGSKWRMIADELGKFRTHVMDAWRRYKFVNAKKGNWSQDEYQTLFELVNKDLQIRVFEEKKSKYGMLRDNISWQAISDNLLTRTHSCCCKKWYKQLTSPMVAEGKWADVDDYRLLMVFVDLDASCEDEVDWDNLLEHRSGDVCHKRWQQMVRHLGEHGNKSFSEQVEVLSKRYCPDLVEVRETFDAKEVVD